MPSISPPPYPHQHHPLQLMTGSLLANNSNSGHVTTTSAIVNEVKDFGDRTGGVSPSPPNNDIQQVKISNLWTKIFFHFSAKTGQKVIKSTQKADDISEQKSTLNAHILFLLVIIFDHFIFILSHCAFCCQHFKMIQWSKNLQRKKTSEVERKQFVTLKKNKKCSLVFICKTNTKMILFSRSQIMTKNDGEKLNFFCQTQNETWRAKNRFLMHCYKKNKFLTHCYKKNDFFYIKLLGTACFKCAFRV